MNEEYHIASTLPRGLTCDSPPLVPESEGQVSKIVLLGVCTAFLIKHFITIVHLLTKNTVMCIYENMSVRHSGRVSDAMLPAGRLS